MPRIPKAIVKTNKSIRLIDKTIYQEMIEALGIPNQIMPHGLTPSLSRYFKFLPQGG